MSSQLWHAEHDLYRLDLPRLSATVDPLNPALGVYGVRVDAQPISGISVLQVALRAVERSAGREGSDCFLRGGDLAITYADRPVPALRSQVYWRAASHRLPGAVAAIELVMSVETSLLDSCPTLATRSELVAERAFRVNDLGRGPFVEISRDDPLELDERASQPSAYLFHLPGGRLSYAQIVYPTDAQLSRYTSKPNGPDRRIELAHTLFAERLEKGVILRARLLGLFLDRANDRDAASEHFAAFLSAELPLTT